MKFEQLYLFKEAVKYNSISVAAEKNFMSQSSVSYSIINLEKELGTELLRRTNAGVSPTMIGELVLQKTEDILKSVDDITEMTRKQQKAGEVSIACIPCICDWIIPVTVQSLKENMAEILLSVTTGESSQVAHDVSAGIAKFGILINYGELERITDLKYTPLFKDEYVLYVGKNSPHWERECITYKELLDEPYIAYRDEFRKYNGGLTNMIGTDKLPNIIFRTDNLDSIKSMITHNHYAAFFPGICRKRIFMFKTA
ncbi:LysR family transcriptional regulator [Lachnospiraceae bacterium 54-53]